MEKIKQGDTYECRSVISQKDVEIFAIISGDRNPIHLDEEYASKSMFGRRIVHGFLAGAVFSKVFGTLWPGEGTIYMSQDMSFRGPVFTDTEYVAKFIVEEVNQEKHRGVVSCNLEALDGKQVIIGKALLKHNDRF
jgi:acyl dehydratase